jgi:prepilin-type N-terminal cleavage/methylation domain-containing protein
MSIKYRTSSHNGFTLIEVVIVIIILGILGTVATRQLGTTIETAQYEQTKNELDELAAAIRGNPDLYSDGARGDFGYVGDIGALPVNLDALVQNPGAYSTWKGPYIERGIAIDDYKKDAWKVNYVYQDTLLRSTGSGSNIDKLYASSRTELLNNTVEGYIVDADRTPPTSSYITSIWIQLVHPNGTGGIKIDSTRPNSSGYFSFSNIAIGNHTLKAVYAPATDTVTYSVTVLPKRTARLNVIFPADLW